MHKAQTPALWDPKAEWKGPTNPLEIEILCPIFLFVYQPVIYPIGIFFFLFSSSYLNLFSDRPCQKCVEEIQAEYVLFLDAH